MKFGALAFLFSNALLLSCLAAATPTEDMNAAVSSVEKFVQQSGSSPILVDLSTQEIAKSFSLMCPIGLVCPGSDYALFLRADLDPGSFMLVFEKSNLSDLSIASLRSTFSYAKFELDFSKEMALSNFKVTTFWGDALVRQDSINGTWDLQSADGGILKGKLTVNLTLLQITRTDAWSKANCEIQDAPQPVGCTAFVSLAKPAEIRFSAVLPTTVRDCQKAGINTPGCG